VKRIFYALKYCWVDGDQWGDAWFTAGILHSKRKNKKFELHERLGNIGGKK